MQYLSLRTHFWNVGTFWVTVAVVLFLVVFGRRLFGAIFGMVDSRSRAIQHELDESQRLRREAESMLAAAERRQAEAMQAATDLLERARSRAERLSQEMAAQAEDVLRRREQMVTDRIHAAEANAIKEVRAAAAALAVDAASRVLRETFDAQQDEALVSGAIDNLPKALRAA